MGVWGNVILALVFPIAWGLGSAWLFDQVGARRKAKAEAAKQAEAKHEL